MQKLTILEIGSQVGKRCIKCNDPFITKIMKNGYTLAHCKKCRKELGMIN